MGVGDKNSRVGKGKVTAASAQAENSPETKNIVSVEGRKTRVSLEVRYEVLAILPESFVHNYEQVYLAAFGAAAGASGAPRDPDAATVSVRSGAAVRTSSGQADARGAARAGGKRAGVSSRTVIRDARAQAIKAGVDRKLRQIARQMGAYLGGGDVARAGVRRCTRCKGWAEDTWNYCPRDGAATEEVT